MAKIEASDRKRVRVKAPMERVYEFFLFPENQVPVLLDLERHELLSDHKMRWVIKEKNEKGVRFQANYVVEYTGNGSDEVTWRTLEGNMETRGKVRLRAVREGVTEIDHEEWLAPDLPIPRLMARVFKPIVSREVRKGIGAFLDRVVEHFGRA